MSNQNSNDSATSAQRQPAKKPYKAPELMPWGSMRDITMAVGSAGADDGGSMKSPRKTR